MTQRRVTATRQLSTVINVIQLGKKTGLLTVERGEGEHLEEGTLTFLQGQVVNATLGSLQGRDAAGALSAWQACHFSFQQKQPHELGITGHTTQAPRITQTSPAQRFSQFTPTPPPFSGQVTPPPQSNPSSAHNTQMSGKMPAIQPNRPAQQQSSMPNDFLNRRPHPTFNTSAIDSVIQAMDRQGYTRLHRHLLLLIDGRRNILELSNLIGHPLDETLILLTDLERAGIVG
jgi:hypothetical protein